MTGRTRRGVNPRRRVKSGDSPPEHGLAERPGRLGLPQIVSHESERGASGSLGGSQMQGVETPDLERFGEISGTLAGRRVELD